MDQFCNNVPFPYTMPDNLPTNLPPLVYNGIYQPIVFWCPVNDQIFPGVEPDRYYISSTGVLFDSKTHFKRYSVLCPILKSDGYVHKELAMADGTRKIAIIHQLVARAFCKFPEELYNSKYRIEVNHIDGIKYHNEYYNLEHCDQSLNQKHNFAAGIVTKNHLTVDQVHLICQMIQDGYSYQEIEDRINELGGCNITNLRMTIYNIRYGHKWKFVSEKYDFHNVDRRYKKG